MKWLHYLFIVSLLLFSCKGQNVKNKRPTRLLTDALQREVALPDTIRQLVCIRSSAIRLVTYAGGAPLICGVEEQETRPNEFTHIFAHPDLARLPIIGPGMGGDPELIMAAGPDVIFMTSTTAGDTLLSFIGNAADIDFGRFICTGGSGLKICNLLIDKTDQRIDLVFGMQDLADQLK